MSKKKPTHTRNVGLEIVMYKVERHIRDKFILLFRLLFSFSPHTNVIKYSRDSNVSCRISKEMDSKNSNKMLLTRFAFWQMNTTTFLIECSVRHGFGGVHACKTVSAHQTHSIVIDGTTKIPREKIVANSIATTTATKAIVPATISVGRCVVCCFCVRSPNACDAWYWTSKLGSIKMALIS